MTQDPAADVQHHGTMPANEDGEGALVAAREKSVQQFLFALLLPLLRGQLAAKMAKTIGQCGRTHERDSLFRKHSHLLIVPARHDFIEEISPPRGVVHDWL